MVTRQGGVDNFLPANRDKASHPCGVQDIAGGVICALSREGCSGDYLKTQTLIIYPAVDPTGQDASNL